jgi:hypothetical protein
MIRSPLMLKMVRISLSGVSNSRLRYSLCTQPVSKEPSKPTMPSECPECLNVTATRRCEAVKAVKLLSLNSTQLKEVLSPLSPLTPSLFSLSHGTQTLHCAKKCTRTPCKPVGVEQCSDMSVYRHMHSIEVRLKCMLTGFIKLLFALVSP